MSPQKIGHLAKQCFNVALPLQVCRSEAGYYIGTVHPKDGPYSRESEEYFHMGEILVLLIATVLNFPGYRNLI